MEPGDKRWCEECDEFLQQYHSLALLEDGQVIPDEEFRPGYKEKQNWFKYRTCRIKKMEQLFNKVVPFCILRIIN